MTTECVNRDVVALSNEREAAETATVVDATTADVDDAIDEAAERRLRVRSAGMLLGGFFAFFTVFGLSFTYGIFYEFYLSAVGPLYGEAPAKVAMVGTLTTAITYSFSIFQPLLRRYLSFQVLMLSGSVLFSLGLFLASVASTVTGFALTQGVLVGLGSSLIYLQPVLLAPQYFSRRRGTAMGVVFSGTGVGAFAMGPFSSYLIKHIGWQNALRTLGALGLVLSVSSCLLIRPHPQMAVTTNMTTTSTPLFNSSVLRSPTLLLHMLCGLLQSVAYLIPTFYMSSYGTTLGFTAAEGALLIGINNIVNAVSKVALGYVADRSIGRFNMLLMCCVASTATVFALWLVPTRSTFLAFVVLYGVCSGPVISLLPTSMVELFGAPVYHSLTAVLFLSRGVGNALGAPIAGVLLRQGGLVSADGFRTVILYTGAALAASSLCAVVLRVLLVMK